MPILTPETLQDCAPSSAVGLLKTKLFKKLTELNYVMRFSSTNKLLHWNFLFLFSFASVVNVILTCEGVRVLLRVVDTLDLDRRVVEVVLASAEVGDRGERLQGLAALDVHRHGELAHRELPNVQVVHVDNVRFVSLPNVMFELLRVDRVGRALHHHVHAVFERWIRSEQDHHSEGVRANGVEPPEVGSKVNYSGGSYHAHGHQHVTEHVQVSGVNINITATVFVTMVVVVAVVMAFANLPLVKKRLLDHWVLDLAVRGLSAVAVAMAMTVAMAVAMTVAVTVTVVVTVAMIMIAVQNLNLNQIENQAHYRNRQHQV